MENGGPQLFHAQHHQVACHWPDCSRKFLVPAELLQHLMQDHKVVFPPIPPPMPFLINPNFSNSKPESHSPPMVPISPQAQLSTTPVVAKNPLLKDDYATTTYLESLGLHVHRTLGFLYCERCQCGTVLREAENHLSTFHSKKTNNLTHRLEITCKKLEIEPLTGTTDKRIAKYFNFKQRQAAVTGLQIKEGFQCQACFKCTCTEQAAEKHAERHRPLAPYVPTLVQQLCKSFPYFAIGSPESSSIPSSQESEPPGSNPSSVDKKLARPPSPPLLPDILSERELILELKMEVANCHTSIQTLQNQVTFLQNQISQLIELSQPQKKSNTDRFFGEDFEEDVPIPTSELKRPKLNLDG